MKSKFIISFLVLSQIFSCGIYKKLKFIVVNKFPLAEEPTNGVFENWNKENLFVLRIELKEENKVTYDGDNGPVIEISDYEFKKYKLLTQPELYNKNIVEEVYLYLSNFDENIQSGSALYMSTMPLMSKTSELIFCNAYFISTYGINHAMTGNWTKNSNNLIKIELTDKDNSLKLKGNLIELKESNSNCIEFTHVSHPKPMDKNDTSLIMFKDIFNVGSVNNEKSETNVNGIRFFQNTQRTFVHPNWSKLGKKFDYQSTADYYRENMEKRKITKVMIGRNEDNIYFEINDPSLASPKNNIIRYNN